MTYNKKGFTLSELLIVVAIIGVLVAISIPVFTSQLEKSRESTDAANIRAQYAQVMAESINKGGSVSSEKIQLKQTKDYWQNESIKNSLAEILETESGKEEPKANCMAWVEFNEEDGSVYLKFSEGGAEEGSQHGIDWASASSVGANARTLLLTGINTGRIYSTDELNDEQTTLISDVKTKLGIAGDVAVHYGWSNYPNIKISVVEQTLNSTDYSSNNTFADWTYAKRIIYNPTTNEIIKVEEEYGRWGNNGGTIGFWANNRGGTYPTTVVYEKN